MIDYSELVKALRETATFTQTNGTLSKRECTLENLAYDSAAAIEALQAEVERMKDVIDELREAQTYIDHYGDKWMTSAKDVPTSAYNHGYMDGKNEAEQALEPKRGEWIGVSPFVDSEQCSICGYCIYSEELETPYCPWCGAKMNGEQNVE